MNGNFITPYLQEIVIFLCVTALIVPSFNRLKINPVLGFLAMGMVLGPFGIALFKDTLPFVRYITMTDNHGIRILAEMGIVFLMFSIGLDLSSSRLWAMRKYVFGMGGLQVLLSSAVIGGAALMFGNNARESVIIGSVLSLSSTAVVIKLLLDRKRLTSPLGQSCFSILLMQDLAVVPILFLIGFFAGKSDGFPLASLFIALIQACAAIAAILVCGRYLLRPLFRFVSVAQSREMFMAAILLVVIATGTLSAFAGMSMAVGAFLAGLMLSETEYRNQIDVDIEPFRGLLLGLFFMSIGMQLNIPIAYKNFLTVILCVFALITVKTLITFMCARIFSIPAALAAAVGLTLSGTGEFAFVILNPSITKGVITSETVQFLMIVATLSIFVSPLIFEVVMLLSKSRRFSERSHYSFASAFRDKLADHIIIAGYGRVGQTIAAFTEIQHMPYIAIDNDGEKCSEMRKRGVRIYFGDAGHWHVLRKINADKAKAVIVTLDNPKSALHTVQAINRFNSDIMIIARAKDKEHADELRAAGATHVVLEAVEMSLQMGSKLLSIMGFTTDAILTMAEKTRDREYGYSPDNTAE